MIYPVYYRGSDTSGKVIVVVGMQYGSEGKGAIVSHLAPIANIGIRSGAANAGHTIYFKGKKIIMRQIPSVWTNPNAKLIIGLGAIISPDILLEEIEHIDKLLPIKDRLFIDYRAHIITPEQIQEEQRTDLALRIGSTSALSKEGIGSAQADKVLRKSNCVQVVNFEPLARYLRDTVELVNESFQLSANGNIVILEGTQGFGLSLDHGRFPFVTSRDTSAMALAASVGLPIHQIHTEIIGVVRTYPIRVAGNSGSFGDDAEEITWDEITRQAGAPNQIIETTSVTGNMRRVGTFSKNEFLKACAVNRPTCLALTFGDYLDWTAHEHKRLTRPIKDFISMLERLSGVPVSFVKTGSKTVVDLEKQKVNDFWRSICKDAAQNIKINQAQGLIP